MVSYVDQNYTDHICLCGWQAYWYTATDHWSVLALHSQLHLHLVTIHSEGDVYTCW